MTPRTRVAAAGGTAFFLALAPVATAASASTADGTPSVVNREVVQAELTSAGKLDVARLFSQLSVVGKGTVAIADPTSSKGLRNLDGFGKPTVRDGKALYTIHVDGSTSRRTVSDYTKALPVSVNATYTLGDKQVSAKDIVGKTGDVSVTYTVTNMTGVPTPISWKDGKGVTHTETVNLVTPLVGQIQTTLPGRFTDLVTPAADVAADGRGGTILTYSMVLFTPIGNETQTFTWSGHVKNGLIPEVEIQLLPASPTQKPELNTGVVGYQEGAEQATQLTDGAGQIDANLLKLQNGAGELLAGLTKLAAGATDLKNGLAGEAAPGAKKLADGAADAKAGSAELASGLGDLSDGANALSGGLGDAKDGSAALAAGLTQISGGLAQLAGTAGLPAAKLGALQLQAGVDALRAGIGAPGQTGTVLDGLARLAVGLTSIRAGLDALASNSTGLPAAKGGVDAVKSGLDGAAATGGSIDQLIAAATGLGGTALALVPSLTDLKTATATAAAGLGQVSTGLGAAILGVQQLQGGVGDTATTDTLRNGVALLQAGVGQIALGLESGDPADPGLAEGLDSLVAGLTTAVAGVSALDAGAADASSGASALDGGLGLLDAGGTQLADGASEAAAGAGQLDDGLGQISSGASDLSAGITKAADGSKQIAEGLDKAKGGDKQVVDGAGQLRSQGTSALVEGGNATAGDASKKYATLVALSNKVGEDALPYGAPEGATGSAAYQLTLAAADTTSHDNRNRAVVAVLLLVAASAVSWLVRRRVATR